MVTITALVSVTLTTKLARKVAAYQRALTKGFINWVLDNYRLRAGICGGLIRLLLINVVVDSIASLKHL